MLSIPEVLSILKDTSLRIVNRGDLTIASEEHEDVLRKILSFSSKESPWQASILVQSPYSVALATRAQPPAAVLFNSYKPVVAVSGPVATLQAIANFLQYFFSQQLGGAFHFAEICILQSHA